MAAIEQVVAQIQMNEQRKQQALDHIKAALELLSGGVGIENARQPKVMIKGDARVKRNFIPAMLKVLEKRGKSMSPADMTGELKKQPEFADIDREQIDQAIWRETKRGDPRLERVGVGLYAPVSWTAKQKKSA